MTTWLTTLAVGIAYTGAVNALFAVVVLGSLRRWAEARNRRRSAQ